MKLSPNQIGVLIYEVGAWGPGGVQPGGGDSASRKVVEDFLDTAIAVAYGESGWDTEAASSTSLARGLWQIMASVHGDKINKYRQYWWGEDGWPEGKIPTVFDPRVNTSVARDIYNEAKAAGRDPWSPWEAYNKKTPAFQAGKGHGKSVYEFLHSEENIRKAWKELQEEIKLGGALGQLGAALIPGGGMGGLPDFVAPVLSFLRESGITIGAFLLGVVLLLVGLWLAVGRRVAKRAPVAKAVSVAKTVKAVTE